MKQMCSRVLVLAAVCAGLYGEAQAQGSVELMGNWGSSDALREPARVGSNPTGREKGYAGAVGRALGLGVRGVQRITHEFEPDGTKLGLDGVDEWTDDRDADMNVQQPVLVGSTPNGEPVFYGSRSRWDTRRIFRVGSPGGPEYKGDVIARMNKAQPRSKSKPKLPRARGVRVELEGGVTVERFFLPTEELAFKYALNGAHMGNPLRNASYVEARGKQVVVARGKKVGDPAFAEKLRSASWGRALPTPGSRPSALGLYSGNGDRFVSTRRPNPVMDDVFRDSLKAARKMHEKNKPGFEQLGDGMRGFEFQDGRRGEVVRRGEVQALWLADSPQGASLFKKLLREALAPPRSSKPKARPRARPRARAYEGAAGRLGRIFD